MKIEYNTSGPFSTALEVNRNELTFGGDHFKRFMDTKGAAGSVLDNLREKASDPKQMGRGVYRIESVAVARFEGMSAQCYYLPFQCSDRIIMVADTVFGYEMANFQNGGGDKVFVWEGLPNPYNYVGFRRASKLLRVECSQFGSAGNENHLATEWGLNMLSGICHAQFDDLKPGETTDFIIGESPFVPSQMPQPESRLRQQTRRIWQSVAQAFPFQG